MPEKVTVEVGANASPFAAGLARIENSLDQFKEKASETFADVGKEMLSGLAFASIVEGIKGIVESAEDLKHLSDRTGESVESLQKLKLIAAETGTSIEEIAKAMRKGAIASAEAIKGNEELKNAFGALGIEAEKFADMPMEEKLEELSEGWNKSGKGAEELSAVIKILGRNGADLIPIFEQGKDKIRETMEESRTATAGSVSAIAAQGEKFKVLWGSFKSYAFDALAGTIRLVESLGVGLASVGSYLGNLKDGFEAAKEAAKQTFEEGTKMLAEKWNKEAEEDTKTRKGTTDVEALEAQSAERKKAGEEQLKLEEEIEKKIKERDLRSLGLEEKKSQLLKDEAAENEAYNKASTNNDRLKSVNRSLDIGKEIEGVNKEIAREKEKTDKENDEKAKKRALEAYKEQIAQTKEEIRLQESKVKELSKPQTFRFDSLAELGGGLKNANYKQGAGAGIQQQHLDVARQTLQELQKVVTRLEKNESAIQQYDGAWSYSG